jgi:hypothetical protein
MHSNAKPEAQQGLISRCSGHRRKEGVLTEGGLLGYEISHKEKSAEVILLGATSPENRGGLTNKEGPNVNWFLIYKGMAQAIAL